MKNTIIMSIVSIICTAAICITCAICLSPKKEETQPETKQTVYSEYLSEKDAAEYIGVTEEVIVMLRKDLKKLEGAYITYTYYDADGKEVSEIVYSKKMLDQSVANYMKSSKGGYSFKFLQERNQKETTTKAAGK